MESCKLCNGTGWVDVRVIPVGGEDLGPVNQDVDNCPLCNLGLSTEDYLNMSTVLQELIPYWLATPIGGEHGLWSLWQNWDVNGNLLQSIYVARESVPGYWSLEQSCVSPDCPVCHGWGVWSNNGTIADCLACGGQPIEARQAFDPICVFWQPWWLKSGLFVPRGTVQV